MEGFVGGVCAQNSVRLLAQGDRARRAAAAPDPPRRPRHRGQAEAPADAGQEIAHDEGSITVRNPCLSGGAIEVFLEPFLPAPRMIVAGDTPIAAALLRLAPELGLDADDSGARTAARRCRPQTTSPWSWPLTGATSARSCARRSRRRSATSGWWPVASAARPCSTSCAPTACPSSCSSGSIRRRASTSAPARRPGSRLDPGRDRQNRRRSSAAPRSWAAAPPTAIDPICGMTVLVGADALSSEHGGDTHYFCGEGCKQAFERQHAA